MNYTHLSIEERCCLRKYYNEGNSLRKTAELMGRNVSTISREIMRNKTYTKLDNSLCKDRSDDREGELSGDTAVPRHKARKRARRAERDLGDAEKQSA